VDLEDSEEEIGVERRERHAIKSDSETNVAIGKVEVVVLEVMMAMEKKQKVMVLIVNMMM
jgi:hypothetical protein